MKTKTKKSDQGEAYNSSASANENSSSSSSSSSIVTEKNHDAKKNFETEIDTAQELNAKKEQWAEFSKKISLDGVLKLVEITLTALVILKTT